MQNDEQLPFSDITVAERQVEDPFIGTPDEGIYFADPDKVEKLLSQRAMEQPSNTDRSSVPFDSNRLSRVEYHIPPENKQNRQTHSRIHVTQDESDQSSDATDSDDHPVIITPKRARVPTIVDEDNYTLGNILKKYLINVPFVQFIR